jgi:hypothetical protein
MWALGARAASSIRCGLRKADDKLFRCASQSGRCQEPIVARLMRILDYTTMTQRLISAVSWTLVSLFVAGLVFDQASAEQQRPVSRQPALSDSRGPTDGTIELAIRNSWARVRRPKTRAPYLTFEKRELYSAVRERLLKSGWQPASTADADQCVKGDSRCEGRPEMQDCAGTGEANCNFRWRKGNIVIDVSTITDSPVVTAISTCHVYCR